MIESEDNLGDKTNELKSEFVSRGPKNNAYRIVNRDGESKTACKVSGNTLHYTASQLVNFDIIRHMTVNENRRGDGSYGETD